MPGGGDALNVGFVAEVGLATWLLVKGVGSAQPGPDDLITVGRG